MQGVGGGGGGGVDQGLQHSMAGLQPGPPCHAGRGLGGLAAGLARCLRAKRAEIAGVARKFGDSPHLTTSELREGLRAALGAPAVACCR
jgi:hypothetical protein